MGILDRLVDQFKSMTGPMGDIVDDISDVFNSSSDPKKYCQTCSNTLFSDGLNEPKCYYCELTNQINYKSSGSSKSSDSTASSGYTSKATKEKPVFKQGAFMVAFISLVAKMAKSDGVVTENEVKAFDSILKKQFEMNVNERKLAASIFNKAKKSSHDYKEISLQVYQTTADHSVILILYSSLFKVAVSNGVMLKAQDDFLLDVGNVFRISQKEYDDIRETAIGESEPSPYDVLGVSKEDSLSDIKKVYRKLILKNHPDKLISKGLPEDFIKEAAERVAHMNAAWEKIQKIHKK